MVSQAIRNGPRVADAIDDLNAVAVTAAQIEAAMRVLAMLPATARADPMAQAVALQGYAIDAGLGSNPTVPATLHARIAALDAWTAANDPDHQSNAEAVIEAAARYPLRDTDDGIGFDHAGFQEMVLFIEGLPW